MTDAKLLPISRKTLYHPLNYAGLRKHEYATLEHLLLALLNDQDAFQVLKGCGVDLGQFRVDLEHYLDHELINLISDTGADAKPTAGFQRVIQRAVIHVDSAKGEVVTGANVLVAVFAERESYAAFFLAEHKLNPL